MTTVRAGSQEDLALVTDCLEGKHEAFEILVGRYQSLICALMYSRCGNVAQIEDLAQETFLAAWKGLPSLKQANQFKAWLCQIARNISANSARVECRKALAHASPIEAEPELRDAKPSPAGDAMAREEEDLVWRALEQLPENYRVPLILFHREDESVAGVATALDLSEDVIRQRLTRGREMLREEVNCLIDGVLKRSRPGKAFTAAILAAVGAGSSTAKAAGLMATAATTATAAKALTGASGLLGLGVVPLIGDWVIWRAIRTKAQTPQERSILNNLALVMALTDVLFTMWMYAVLRFAPSFERSDVLTVVIVSVIGFALLRWMQIFLILRRANWLGPLRGGGSNIRKGYAPGWQVRCPKCGLTVGAGEAGLIRVWAAGDTRRLGPCSRCKRFRWLIIERVPHSR